MFSMLIGLAATLTAPAEAGTLRVTNVRVTHGILGPTRQEDELLPGDSFVICYSIEGLTPDASGKVKYSTQVEVSDDKGNILFKQEKPRDIEAVNALGGGQVPAFGKMDIGINQSPGAYHLKLTITEPATKKSTAVRRSVKVLPPGFGLVRLHTSTDASGDAPAAALAVGQTLWVNAGVVGFAREAGAQQPRIRLQLRVMGEDGKPTVRNPFTGVVDRDVPSAAVSVPAQFVLTLNRSGKFTVELRATDDVSSKSSTLSFPINVLPSH